MTRFKRAPLFAPMTRAQQAVVAALARNAEYDEIARWLSVKERTVRYHVGEAARKIPGNLPPKMRIIMWARGATIDMLEGRTLGSPENLIADMKKTGT
jgi:DNA-binding NarL/FixJ family response regulator